MNKQFSLPRGTSDILPGASSHWEFLETQSRQILKSYGYREIRTPIYEETALFKRSLGQTSDIVNKQLLELATDKDEGYALRPEGTAAVVRSYVKNLEGVDHLQKLFYIGPMFRGERPQKGRLRQFHQIGVEAIGPNGASPFLDAEMLTLAMHLLQEFGVKNPKLKINSLGSDADKEHISAWLRGEFTKHKNDLCPDCQNRFERNVFRVLDCKNELCKVLVQKILSDKGLPLSEDSSKYFASVRSSLEDAGIAYEVSPQLVRGLDYYTHTVFELTAEGLGSQDAVGAGGRYSGLVHELGGNPKIDFGAVGFALGMERVLLSMPLQGAMQALDVFVVVMKPDYMPQAMNILAQLRKAGISADTAFTSRSMKSQMRLANDWKHARFVLILGEEEVKSQSVAVKDMQAHTQEIIKMQDIVAVMSSKGLGKGLGES